jgi:hypothetical protein
LHRMACWCDGHWRGDNGRESVQAILRFRQSCMNCRRTGSGAGACQAQKNVGADSWTRESVRAEVPESSTQVR